MGRQPDRPFGFAMSAYMSLEVPGVSSPTNLGGIGVAETWEADETEDFSGVLRSGRGERDGGGSSEFRLQKIGRAHV